MSNVKNIWFCKIGENTGELPTNADHLMRMTIIEAYNRLAGKMPNFIFSGWGGKLSESERAVLENRMPPPEPTYDWPAIEKSVDDYIEDYDLDDTIATASENQRFLIKDAIMGLLADEKFLAAVVQQKECEK